MLSLRAPLSTRTTAINLHTVLMKSKTEKIAHKLKLLMLHHSISSNSSSLDSVSCLSFSVFPPFVHSLGSFCGLFTRTGKNGESVVNGQLASVALDRSRVWQRLMKIYMHIAHTVHVCKLFQAYRTDVSACEFTHVHTMYMWKCALDGLQFTQLPTSIWTSGRHCCRAPHDCTSILYNLALNLIILSTYPSSHQFLRWDREHRSYHCTRDSGVCV